MVDSANKTANAANKGSAAAFEFMYSPTRAKLLYWKHADLDSKCERQKQILDWEMNTVVKGLDTNRTMMARRKDRLDERLEAIFQEKLLRQVLVLNKDRKSKQKEPYVTKSQESESERILEQPISQEPTEAKEGPDVLSIVQESNMPDLITNTLEPSVPKSALSQKSARSQKSTTSQRATDKKSVALRDTKEQEHDMQNSVRQSDEVINPDGALITKSVPTKHNESAELNSNPVRKSHFKPRPHTVPDRLTQLSKHDAELELKVKGFLKRVEEFKKEDDPLLVMLQKQGNNKRQTTRSAVAKLGSGENKKYGSVVTATSGVDSVENGILEADRPASRTRSKSLFETSGNRLPKMELPSLYSTKSGRRKTICQVDDSQLRDAWENFSLNADLESRQKMAALAAKLKFKAQKERDKSMVPAIGALKASKLWKARAERAIKKRQEDRQNMLEFRNPDTNINQLKGTLKAKKNFKKGIDDTEVNNDTADTIVEESLIEETMGSRTHFVDLALIQLQKPNAIIIKHEVDPETS